MGVTTAQRAANQKLWNHSVPSLADEAAPGTACPAADKLEVPAPPLSRLNVLLLASRPPADATTLLPLLPGAEAASLEPAPSHLLLKPLDALRSRAGSGLPPPAAAPAAGATPSALERADLLLVDAAAGWLAQLWLPDTGPRTSSACSSSGASSGTTGWREKGSRNTDMRRERRRCLT